MSKMHVGELLPGFISDHADPSCRYRYEHYLAHGASGITWLVIRNCDNRTFAMKITEWSKVGAQSRMRTDMEIRCLESVNHFACVRLEDRYESKAKLYLVMEYCDAGDLFYQLQYLKSFQHNTSIGNVIITKNNSASKICLKENRAYTEKKMMNKNNVSGMNGGNNDGAACGNQDNNICTHEPYEPNDQQAKQQMGMNEHTVKYILLQLVLGLHYLHMHCNILHRDLKPANVLLTTHGLVKIGDFGLSKVYQTTTGNVGRTLCGTPEYTAPELWQRQHYGCAADMWSLGVLTYECMSGRLPFAERKLELLQKQVLNQEPAPITGPYTTDLIDIVMSLLSKNPEERPDSNQLLATPYLREALKNFAIVLKQSKLSIMQIRQIREDVENQFKLPPRTIINMAIHYEGDVLKYKQTRCTAPRYLILRKGKLFLKEPTYKKSKNVNDNKNNINNSINNGGANINNATNNQSGIVKIIVDAHQTANDKSNAADNATNSKAHTSLNCSWSVSNNGSKKSVNNNNSNQQEQTIAMQSTKSQNEVAQLPSPLPDDDDLDKEQHTTSVLSLSTILRVELTEVENNFVILTQTRELIQFISPNAREWVEKINLALGAKHEEYNLQQK